ncbi:hypothetical protein D917_10605 [Trichinella nativa]|uniref:Uncharacterized protein n=1 Tax=Trichinella nativa TaxID=6335 RepID=A0A1Y3E9V8_9BILA|nr:hypothetical protein D917_10605 [Trichinella nativa]
MLHMPEQYAKLWKLIHASCATKLNFLSEPLHKAIGESSLNVKTDSTLFKHPGERSKKERQKTAEQRSASYMNLREDLKGERKIQRLLRNAGITVINSAEHLTKERRYYERTAVGAIFIAGARVWLLCQRSKRKLSKKLSRPGHVSFELVQRIFKLGKDAKTDCTTSRYGIHQKTPTAHSEAKASMGRLVEYENIHLHLKGENTG